MEGKREDRRIRRTKRLLIAIAERVGHESIDITYRYAHLFPTRQTDMVQQLELKRAEGGF